MPSISSAHPRSTSGIITSETGERHIPSSMRSDGTTRKEIRVRPGYRPPEDVEVYKNRTAEAWKTRGSGGVPGAENIKSAEGTENAKANNKNAKRREARKKAMAVEAEEKAADTSEKGSDVAVVNGEPDKVDKAEEKGQDLSSSLNHDQKPKDPHQETEALDRSEKEKRARKLKKKLREARELQEKKEKGEGLLQEQFEKVIRINELIRDLEKLGFNADGEPIRD